MAEKDPEKLAEDLEREVDDLQERSEDLKERTEDVTKEWERKREDPNVPGAQPPEGDDGAAAAEADETATEGDEASASKGD